MQYNPLLLHSDSCDKRDFNYYDFLEKEMTSSFVAWDILRGYYKFWLFKFELLLRIEIDANKIKP